MELDLTSSLADLRRHTDAGPLATVTLLADVVLYSLCIDVVEHATAVEMISRTPIGRAASTNARAALESAMDAAYLTERFDEYNQRGAMARAAELFEVEEIERRSPAVAGGTESSESSRLSAEEVVLQDARDFDEYAVGSGSHLRAAWANYAKTTGALRKHWSGLSKDQLYSKVFGQGEAGDPIDKMVGVMHAVLSSSSHPRPRVGARTLSQSPDGSIVISTRAAELGFVQGMASIACTMASAALARRALFPVATV